MTAAREEEAIAAGWRYVGAADVGPRARSVAAMISKPSYPATLRCTLCTTGSLALALGLADTDRRGIRAALEHYRTAFRRREEAR